MALSTTAGKEGSAGKRSEDGLLADGARDNGKAHAAQMTVASMRGAMGHRPTRRTSARAVR
jgi:hypothetical protein